MQKEGKKEHRKPGMVFHTGGICQGKLLKLLTNICKFQFIENQNFNKILYISK